MNKKITAVIAVLVMVFALGVSAGASGTTPRPTQRASQTQSTPRVAPDTSSGSSSEQDTAEESGSSTEEGSASSEATAAPSAAAENSGLQNTYTTPIPAENEGFFSRSVSRGGMIIWFVLAVAASAVISFAMGNRFARLAKKDNRLSAEVRALRRDIDEKMSERVGGFTEKELDIKNTAKKYFDDPQPEEIAQSGENMYEKWETQLAQTRPKRPVIKTKTDPEAEKAAAKAARAEVRSRSVPKPEEIKNSAKGRMQDVIEEMFPFDDDPR